MVEATYIYALVDPRDEQVRYIGQSINPARRLFGHVAESRWRVETYLRYNHLWTRLGHKPSAKQFWVHSLLIEDLRPKIKIIEHCENGKDLERELSWIRRYNREGFDLVNRDTHKKRID